MILIKLNAYINFKSLIIDFYLLIFVIFLTVLINPKNSTSLVIESSLIDNQYVNNNNNEEKFFIKITTRHRHSSNNLNSKQHQHHQEQTFSKKQTTKKPQITRNIPIIISTNLNNNNFNNDDNLINEVNDHSNRSDIILTNDNLLVGSVDYIGYNQSVTSHTSNSFGDDGHAGDYWALILLLFPISTIFGNSLVVLSVIKEKNLHTVTNYFVVSLALADLTVATAVMPFAVYYEVTKRWLMSKVICDAWVATDVMASTASILNLVAIAIDRFIAVTQPLKYARHKNSNRIYFMIGFVWLVSIAIASPIVAGLNDTPDREIDQCAFNNEKFLIYSSMISFYIPTIVMVILYYKIFKVIRSRAKKSTAAKYVPKTQPNKLNNKVNNKPDTKSNESKPIIDDANNSSNSQNKKSNNNNNNKSIQKISLISAGIFRLKNKTVMSSAKRDLDSKDLSISLISNNNSNNLNETKFDDKASNRLDTSETTKESTNSEGLLNPPNKSKENSFIKDKKGAMTVATTKLDMKNSKSVAQKGKASISVLRSQSIALTAQSSNKEKKVTKTLAIVLIVFLVCWSPFFAVNNLMKGICKEYKINCSFIKDELISFLTWLGYLNSLLNPIIYTIFNLEFRKAFAKILAELCCKKTKN